MRNTVILGNWKLNKDQNEAIEFCSLVYNFFHDQENQRKMEEKKLIVGVAPQAPILSTVIRQMPHRVMTLGQNCFHEDKGAFTGEVSASTLSSVGVSGVLVGHSERRVVFNEENETIRMKLEAILNGGLKAIFCCGEDLEIREKNEQEKFVREQLESALKNVSGNQILDTFIAYEPIWAIGTGKTASADDAENMASFIREFIKTKYNDLIASKAIILYGGSVKPNNVQEICSKANIDGCLVGGASLDPKSFIELLENC